MNNPFIDPHYSFHRQTEPANQRRLSEWFFKSNIKDYQRYLKHTSEDELQARGITKALNLFHLAAEHIPAYKKFLKNHHIHHQSVKTPQDFSQVPPTDKPTYFTQHPLNEFAWGGRLETANTVSFSSGSTGKPFFWPRSTYQDYEGALAFEHLLTSLFAIDRHSTLLVNCFSMGNYVAGVYVYTSAHFIAQKGYPLTIVSPGINYQDTFNILEKIIDQYDQIILAGYPPFLRDIIELGDKFHLNWSKHRLKFFFASEFFSESWRDITLQTAGNHQPLIDSTNIYGTADSAIFAFETPISILVRKLASQNNTLHQSLFNSSLTPTLVQYNPLLTYFESIGSEITLTSNSGLPLIRYNLKDQGGVFSNRTLADACTQHHLDLDKEIEIHDLKNARYPLPHLFITNRSDGAASFYAILIYPQYIRTGLETAEFQEIVSGKFSLFTGHSHANQPTLEIHIELKEGVRPSKKLETAIQTSIIKGLKQRCAEYSFLEKSIKNRAKPRITLHPKGTSQYFQIGIKQKWIVK